MPETHKIAFTGEVLHIYGRVDYVKKMRCIIAGITVNTFITNYQETKKCRKYSDGNSIGLLLVHFVSHCVGRKGSTARNSDAAFIGGSLGRSPPFDEMSDKE